MVTLILTGKLTELGVNIVVIAECASVFPTVYK